MAGVVIKTAKNKEEVKEAVKIDDLSFKIGYEAGLKKGLEIHETADAELQKAADDVIQAIRLWSIRKMFDDESEINALFGKKKH